LTGIRSIGESHRSKHAESLKACERTVLKIRTSNEEFYRCFTQDVADMAPLRLPIRGTDHMVFVPAAAGSLTFHDGSLASLGPPG
jgi:hypothetical protein